MTTTLTQSTVTRIREIAPGAFVLSFPRGAGFTPGQCLDITVDPAIPPRAYSISSGRDDPEWEVLFTVVPGGLLTPRLAALKPGDRILISAPFGELRDEEGSAVWIASGTGIAPFASMARSGMTAAKILIHGSRTRERLFYREAFERTVEYVPCCTAERGPGIYHGRLTAFLEEREPSSGAARALEAGARCLLCGSTEMVVETREILLARGVPFPKIAAEIYF